VRVGKAVAYSRLDPIPLPSKGGLDLSVHRESQKPGNRHLITRKDDPVGAIGCLDSLQRCLRILSAYHRTGTSVAFSVGETLNLKRRFRLQLFPLRVMNMPRTQVFRLFYGVFGLLVFTGCASLLGPAGWERVVGVIDTRSEFSPSPIQVPDVVSQGVPFTAVVVTFGSSSCTRADGGEDGGRHRCGPSPLSGTHCHRWYWRFLP
jgi:hypothetical protein